MIVSELNAVKLSISKYGSYTYSSEYMLCGYYKERKINKISKQIQTGDFTFDLRQMQERLMFDRLQESVFDETNSDK